MSHQINTPAPSEKLAVAYKISPRPLLELANVLNPVTIVDDLSGESIGSRGFPRNASGSFEQAAGGVGTNAEVIFTGPGGRGLIYHVTRVIVNDAAAAAIIEIRIGQAPVTISTVGTTLAYRDTRLTDSPNGTVGGATPLTAAKDGIQVDAISIPSDEGILIPLDFVCGEGSFVACVNRTVDEAIWCSYWWTEYLLEDR